MFDTLRDFTRPSHSASYAESGMVATAHPEACLAGLDVLRSGGTAADAAIAAAAVLALVEPSMTGIGGDVFVLHAAEGRAPEALNGSGRAPAAASLDEVRGSEIAADSVQSVTVPGAIDAWLAYHARHGTRPLEELFRPAIRLAREGYRVTPRVALDWQTRGDRLRHDPDAAAAYLPGGRTPQVGDKVTLPALAATLERIAREGRSAFYEGAVAAEIVGKLRARGGRHAEADLAGNRPDWVEPIQAEYRGFQVHECPPNNQGLAALLILRLLEGFDHAAAGPAGRVHLLAEATKLAYAMRDRVIADPDHLPFAPEAILAEAEVERLRALIDPERAAAEGRWIPPGTAHRDTTYLCVVDRALNAVSFINSLYDGFGSGIYAPESGVLLHCRGAGFVTEPGHPNAYGPGKRPFHTLIPGLLAREGEAVMPFGVMGGHYQATGHAQVLIRMLDLGLDPQQAIEAPRSFAYGGRLELEAGVPEEQARALAALGHRIERVSMMGGGQAIWIDRRRGVLIGGTESRKDGLALGY